MEGVMEDEREGATRGSQFGGRSKTRRGGRRAHGAPANATTSDNSHAPSLTPRTLA